MVCTARAEIRHHEIKSSLEQFQEAFLALATSKESPAWLRRMADVWKSHQGGIRTALGDLATRLVQTGLAAPDGASLIETVGIYIPFSIMSGMQDSEEYQRRLAITHTAIDLAAMALDVSPNNNQSTDRLARIIERALGTWRNDDNAFGTSAGNMMRACLGDNVQAASCRSGAIGLVRGFSRLISSENSELFSRPVLDPLGNRVVQLVRNADVGEAPLIRLFERAAVKAISEALDDRLSITLSGHERLVLGLFHDLIVDRNSAWKAGVSIEPGRSLADDFAYALVAVLRPDPVRARLRLVELQRMKHVVAMAMLLSSPPVLAALPVEEIRVAYDHLALLGGADVAQTLAVGQLRKGHRPDLLGVRQHPNAFVATMARHDPMKGLPRQKVHDLGEQRLAGVHGGLRAKSRKPARIGNRRSNRHHPSSLGNPRQSWLSAIRPFI